MTDALSLNTKVILLLTAPLIVGRDRSPADLLSASTYKKLSRVLRERQREPADLLGRDAGAVLAECATVVEIERLRRLLDRGFLMSQAVERWQARAIWVVSRADPGYPQRLKARLREDAPALLYGCGECGLLNGGGLAVVGSRDTDEAILDYAQAIGALAAKARRALVSGGARGVDQAAMRGALEAGGRATGVLADSLERAALQRDHRNMILDERLVLVSPYDPNASFNVGNAMQRNKAIYALSDAALVVNSDFDKGGTWAGATEQLDKLRLVPVFVRGAGAPSQGLDALIGKGAVRWPEPKDAEGLEAAIDAATSEALPPTQTLLALSPKGDAPPEAEPTDTPPRLSEEAAPPPTMSPALTPADALLAKVRELVLPLARKPVKAAEIARHLDVSDSQAKAWLERLVTDGVLEKSKKPVLYSVARRGLFEPQRADSSTAESKVTGGRP